MVTTATLCVSCTDQTGLVAALSDFVFRHGGNIIHADQHSEANRFYMRLHMDVAAFEIDRDGITMALQVLAKRYEMDWNLHYNDKKPQVALFASKQPHCLYDLLLRQHMGELPGEIALVISNHEDCRSMVEQYGIPYHCIPVTASTKQEAENQQRELLAQHAIDTVVLARYMQILSASFAEDYAGRIINIHHSFLPAFAGAKPYHQAKERGVKLIGATAHYVTADLDEGPIIAQDVIHISHKNTVQDLVRKGRDIERRVLANALRLHLDNRVFVENNRTIVFE